LAPAKRALIFCEKYLTTKAWWAFHRPLGSAFKDNLNRLYKQGADDQRLDEYIWRWRQAVSVPKMGFWVSIEGIGFRSIVDKFRAPAWRSK